MNEEPRGAGWVLFAGIMILIAGVFNCIWGVAAIDRANFFIEDERFIISELQTWGWIILIVGVVQIFAGLSIWAGSELGRVIGIVSASLSAIGALLSVPGYPFWSLSVFALDILVIYGLVAYGGRQSRVAQSSPGGV